jgi:hypothetical protein
MNFNFWDSSKGNIPVAMPMSLGVGASVAGLSQVSGAGISPGATGVDSVLAILSIPAGAFASPGNGIFLSAIGSFANNGNAKRLKIIFNPTTAVVGSTVSGGTVIGDTGAYSTAALSAFDVDCSVFKYGISGSNTQIGLNNGCVVAGTSPTLIVPQLLTATESQPILIAVTGNAGTAVADILLYAFVVQPIS